MYAIEKEKSVANMHNKQFDKIMTNAWTLPWQFPIWVNCLSDIFCALAKTDNNGFDGWAIVSNCFVIIMAKSTMFNFLELTLPSQVGDC